MDPRCLWTQLDQREYRLNQVPWFLSQLSTFWDWGRPNALHHSRDFGETGAGLPTNQACFLICEVRAKTIGLFHPLVMRIMGAQIVHVKDHGFSLQPTANSSRRLGER